MCKYSLYVSPAQVACYDNDLDAYVPEIWAQESLEILKENMVAAGLVHRDFSPKIAKFGDRVHTRKPGEFKISRRTDATTVASQDASATDVPVDLNQWFNQTFTIRPSEMSLSFKELVSTYLEPAMLAIARGIDRAVLGRGACAFLADSSKRAGRLEELTYANVYDWVVDVDKIMNENKVPSEGRSLVIAPSSKAQMLKSDKFVKANERGDGGSAMRSATIGEMLGFDVYMAQNVSSVQTGADVALLAVDGAGAQAAEYAGAINVAISGVVGEFLVIAGNAQPTYMTDVSTGAIVLHEALKYAIANSAVAKHYKSCAVATTRAAGYSEEISLKSHTTAKGPQVGQLIAFCDASTGANRHTYVVIESTVDGTTSEVVLDRPLDTTITADSTVVCPGPYGSFNLGLHKNALALVTRPLEQVSGAGMMTAVADAYGLGVRVSMQDVINVGRVVAVDLLAGVAVLDDDLCVPLLG